MNEKLHRPIQLIANLFFEEAKLQFQSSGNDGLILHFQILFEDSVKVSLILRDGQGKEHHALFEQELPVGASNKENFKLLKQGISRVLVSVLQEWTGMRQKWGILTGVRPTKLLHRKNIDKIPMDVAHQQLKEEYLITDDKINLMKEIVDRQLAVVPDLYDLKKEVSIYLGIPFCPTKCAYCTFPAYAINGRQGSVNSFLGGLHYEMQMIGEWLKENDINITTVYFGGGTPTSITACEMDLLYEEMYRSFPNVEIIREVTVEAGRPGHDNSRKAKRIEKVEY